MPPRADKLAIVYMKYSSLFGKTTKNPPSDADSANARLLEQGGFVDHVMAGVYTYLPLGRRVLENVKRIIREEMDKIGQEVAMPALLPKEPWAMTGRWTDPGPEVMYQFKGRGDSEVGLGWSHEEIVTPLAKKYVRSYRDLPLALYQIQTKFRKEPRAKSGLLRGREFPMKDLYSFHRDEADFEAYYEKAKEAYFNVFRRCGLDALIVEASGGAFSKYSHEFQVFTEAGEDTVYWCATCRYAQNKEISEMRTGDRCPKCGGEVKESKAIEVGNIFPLKTRFTGAFDFTYMDESGAKKEIVMGCYGIGVSRLMGTIVEVHHDGKGIIWPKAVAPFPAHLVALKPKDPEQEKLVRATAESVERELAARGIELLVDDRDASAGEKFADADLVGCPLRLVVSEKTLAKGGVEWKFRASEAAEIVPLDDLVARVMEWDRA